jgi:acid phosphatase (class A)
MIANLSADLRPAISASKTVFRRDRPFVGQSDARTCDPRAREGRDPDALSFSYPSGHAAFGELWALALSDAVPAARPRILAWGRQLGDDRVVCRVHYPSDVAAGRRLADALFARIKASPRFQADLKAAQSELARVAAPANCPA